MERADQFGDSLFINWIECKPRASGCCDREYGPGGAGPYRGEDSELFSTLLQKWPIWEKLVRPDFVEDVGETDKTAVGIYALVAGGGVGIGDVLEGTFHVEGPVFIQEKNAKVIRPVVPPKACAAAASVTRKAAKESVGKKALLPNN